MSKTAESLVVFAIAIAAMVVLVLVIGVFFRDSTVGNALFGAEPECGCDTTEQFVCGEDLVTYRNPCIASCHQVRVQYDGVC